MCDSLVAHANRLASELDIQTVEFMCSGIEAQDFSNTGVLWLNNLLFPDHVTATRATDEV